MTSLSGFRFFRGLGVNSHIDFDRTAYRNLPVVIDALKYLGVPNVRDCPNNPDMLGRGIWKRVADAAGVKFTPFLTEGNDAQMRFNLSQIEGLAAQGVLRHIDGANEPDAPYAVAQGGGLMVGAALQDEVFALGRKLGLPVINMSTGQGWDKSPSGNYGKFGDMAAYCDYANAHTYPTGGQPVLYGIRFVNGLARLSAGNRPVAITEIGWHTVPSLADVNTVPELVQAKYIARALFHAFAEGAPLTYLYELLDQKTGDASPENNFGLFRSDGSGKPAAVIVRNIALAFKDAEDIAPRPLDATFTGLKPNHTYAVLQHSEGKWIIAIWRDDVLYDPATRKTLPVTLDAVSIGLPPGAAVAIADPLGGGVSKPAPTRRLDLQLVDFPLLVTVTVPQAATAAPQPTPEPTYTIAQFQAALDALKAKK